MFHKRRLAGLSVISAAVLLLAGCGGNQNPWKFHTGISNWLVNGLLASPKPARVFQAPRALVNLLRPWRASSTLLRPPQRPGRALNGCRLRRFLFVRLRCRLRNLQAGFEFLLARVHIPAY